MMEKKKKWKGVKTRRKTKQNTKILVGVVVVMVVVVVVVVVIVVVMVVVVVVVSCATSQTFSSPVQIKFSFTISQHLKKRITFPSCGTAGCGLSLK